MAAASAVGRLLCAALLLVTTRALPSKLVEPSVHYNWLYNCSAPGQLPYAHNVILESGPGTTVYAAFQAGATEGADMHLRFTLSDDGGKSWEESSIVVPSVEGRSGWGPVLVFDPATEILHLYYALSRTVVANFSNPGGDVFHKQSFDSGKSWGDSVLILSQDAFDQHPKYLVNQVARLPSGDWLIAFGTTSPSYPSTTGAAGLISCSASNRTDCSLRPQNWTIPPSPYVSAILEPALTIVNMENNVDRCFVVFRSANGYLYESRSVDNALDGCHQWTDLVETKVPNPNSRPSITTAASIGAVMVLASNTENDGISRWPAWGNRSLLTLMTSVGGNGWQKLVQLEGHNDVSHCYPSIINRGDGGYIVAYSVYRTNIPRLGIEVAVVDV